jgi:hypothetical protein
MGKRHQASRRKAYGRRQHEIRERIEHPRDPDGEPIAIDVYDVPPYDGQATDRFGGYDLRVPAGLRYAIGD